MAVTQFCSFSKSFHKNAQNKNSKTKTPRSICIAPRNKVHNPMNPKTQVNVDKLPTTNCKTYIASQEKAEKNKTSPRPEQRRIPKLSTAPCCSCRARRVIESTATETGKGFIYSRVAVRGSWLEHMSLGTFEAPFQDKALHCGASLGNRFKSSGIEVTDTQEKRKFR